MCYFQRLSAHVSDVGSVAAAAAIANDVVTWDFACTRLLLSVMLVKPVADTT